MSNNHVTKLKRLKANVDGLMERLDVSSKQAEIATLEAQSSETNFWEQPDAAQKTMQRLSKLRDAVTPWQVMNTRIKDMLELAELDDNSLDAELDQEVAAIESELDKMSFQAMLSGEYDSEDAILAIHAGAGGTDSQDWAEMLERMYIRWAEDHRYKVEIIERSEGDEAGIKSVMMSIGGNYAYGYLRSEQGVHRLVRLSPFDAASRRHTSFTKVELWPDIQGEIGIEIGEKDLRVDTYRASGAGGQHVQKNDTAVRITHLPTGIVVQCQNQRSQAQNRDRALQILKARLLELEHQKQEAELAMLKGENVDAGWGNQIRSYVLHPYQLVKDHRTNFEVGNVNAVLDGGLDELMEAYLRAQIKLTEGSK